MNNVRQLKKCINPQEGELITLNKIFLNKILSIDSTVFNKETRPWLIIKDDNLHMWITPLKSIEIGDYNFHYDNDVFFNKYKKEHNYLNNKNHGNKLKKFDIDKQVVAIPPFNSDNKGVKVSILSLDNSIKIKKNNNVITYWIYRCIMDNKLKKPINNIQEISDFKKWKKYIDKYPKRLKHKIQSISKVC